MKYVQMRFHHIFQCYHSVKQMGLQIACKEEIIQFAPLIQQFPKVMLNVSVEKNASGPSGPDIIPLSQIQHWQIGTWLQHRILNRGKIKCYQHRFLHP